MKTVLTILNAVVGFAGSSENPSKMSMRFMGIVMAVVAQVTPILLYVAGLVMDLPEGVTPTMVQDSLGPVVQAVTFVVAGILWLVGATRAAMKAYSVQERAGAYLNS